MKPVLVATLGSLALVMSGCAGLTAADRGPRGDPVARLTMSTPSPWREDLGDPVLKELLEQADAGALDGKVALARLERADAEVEAADAVRGINVIAGFEAAVGGRTFHTAGSAATPTLEVTNEVDVWGRIRRAREASRSEQDAARADAAQARLLVAAQTARAYLALRDDREIEATAVRRQRLAEQALDLARTRAAQGYATTQDCDARRIAVDAAADLAEKAREDARLQLARLGDLAGHPTAVETSTQALPLAPTSGPVASTVVDARPDVRAALARVAAADRRRASVIAASRPQFQIAAAFGAPDAAIATLLDVRALAWAVAATVSHEILDGGARRAKVHVATAEADLADLAYRQTVLTAWSEVREALVAEARARRALQAADAGVSAAGANLVTGQARHAAGAADGLAIIALRDALEQANGAAAQARLAVADTRVQLALATGGG